MGLVAQFYHLFGNLFFVTHSKCLTLAQFLSLGFLPGKSNLKAGVFFEEVGSTPVPGWADVVLLELLPTLSFADGGLVGTPSQPSIGRAAVYLPAFPARSGPNLDPVFNSGI